MAINVVMVLVRTWGVATILCGAFLTFTSVAAQQLDGSQDKPVPAKASDGKPEAPGKVEVQPVAEDDEISQRIKDILEATGWFGAPDGV